MGRCMEVTLIPDLFNGYYIEIIFSDDEGEGAETEAVSKDQNRRRDVLQAVIDEVAKTNKKYVK